ncbi:GDP-mannose 4,6-dehydratase, partial [Candidatus Pseudothioglobus singularis]|nr:GDP-mannose 4,6-dehydratase [Candidatus Pseudothioglobus singularis]
VFGIVNPRSSKGIDSLNRLSKSVKISNCNINDLESLKLILCDTEPDEIYHLASSVEPRVLNNQELSIFDVNFIPGLHILNIVKNFLPKAKIYFAGSSLMFGDTSDSSQSELTPMRPNTPYGIAKVALYNFMKMYREVYGIFACMGILYNHESPIRNEKFLPRKITKTAVRIKLGKQSELVLGDLTISRDWSYAGDIVNSMFLMLNQDKPKDYVVGSGTLFTPKDILNIAFNVLNLDWRKYVKTDSSLFRSVEYTKLCADTSKIRNDLNWKPSMSLNEIIVSMVEEDMRIENKND